MKNTIAGLFGCVLSLGLVAAGCDAEAPTSAQTEAAHAHGLVLVRGGNSALAEFNPELAQLLRDLRNLVAPFHDFDASQDAGYTFLFNAPPATEADGCISDPALGGMGYHYALVDGTGFPFRIFDGGDLGLLEPEFLVYAPKKGPKATPGGETRTRFAGLEYVVPFTDVAADATPPVLPEFEGLAERAELDGQPGNPFEFFPSERFGVWIFHIWLYQHNPEGLLEDFNPAVPLCE